MQQTFKVAETDNFIMMKTRQRETQVHTEKMKALFETADDDGNGLLDLEEFKKTMNHKWVKEWMSAYGVAIDDVEKLWFLLNRDNDAKITAEELVEGVLEL